MENKIFLTSAFLAWRYYAEPKTCHLFLHLLLRAATAETVVNNVKLIKGQLLTSQTELIRETGLTRQEVRTALHKLAVSREIKTSSLKVAAKLPQSSTLITICNFASYIEHQPDINQTSTRHQPDINQTKPTSTPSSAGKKEKIDYTAFIEFWNKTVADTRVPQIKKLADARRLKLTARMFTYGKKAIFNVVEKIPKSDFLSGRAADFRATFDWLFSPSNFPKALDGNYDNDKNNTKQNETHQQQPGNRRRGYDAVLHSAEDYEKEF